MKVGHVFTIEPMINEGRFHEQQWPDGWTSVTRDGKRLTYLRLLHTCLSHLNRLQIGAV